MRIVHVLTRLLRAGSEENTLASCLAQAAAGHEVHLVHGRDFDPRYYETLTDRIHLRRVGSLVHHLAPFHDSRAFLEMRSMFRRLRPDVVHTHQSKAGIVGRFAARAARVPHIIHGVHIVPFVNVGTLQRIVYLTAEKVASSVTDAFIDVSRGMRDICLEAGIGKPEQHLVIQSGFELARFHSACPPEDWREILGIGPDEPRPPVVTMLAALEPRKRHCEFLDVLPRILSRFPDLRLILPGEGPTRGAIEAKIHDLGLERNVRLVGYRTDPEKLIALADLCALTSTREGLPRVIMQYLAVGRACVVSDLPGLDEVVQDDVNGVVTPSDDMAAAADAITALLEDRERLTRLSHGAAATDLANWEVTNMCDRIEEVYRNLASAETK
jgi:glycosyltransferase involved in cell wall biosynthesis